MSTSPAKTQTRIQEKNRAVILEAGLSVFAAHGFRGATLDQIARDAGLSKPNLLYYFSSKEAIYAALLEQLLDTWLDPLRAMDPEGDPRSEILAYMRRKLALARDYPRESRLFATEIIQGAPHISTVLTKDLKPLVDHWADIIHGWSEAGKIARVDPYHLIFSIWSLTQHYADFDAQVGAVLGGVDPFPGAESHLEQMFGRLLAT